MKVSYSRRTIHAANLQTSLILDKPYTILPNSTLNEKFNIAADEVLAPEERPSVKYYSIGRGGHQSIAGSDGVPNVGPLPQFSSHSALYKHLPFVLRPVNDDIGEAERAKYGLRRVETHNEQDYYAYYLKRLDLDDVNVKVEYNKVLAEGGTTSIAYEPRIEDLSPTPVNIPVGALPTAADSLSALATIPIVFNANDVIEFKNAVGIIYGSTEYATISEIGICSGVDRILPTPGQSGEFNFNEAVAVQILTMLTTYNALNFNSLGFSLDVELGSAESLSI